MILSVMSFASRSDFLEIDPGESTSIADLQGDLGVIPVNDGRRRPSLTGYIQAMSDRKVLM
ncbi:MAG: hypothetical protein NVSMB14_15570 [Isosphaeraceae bacterium]